MKKTGDVFDEKYPARQVFTLIADKWTPVVLYALSGGLHRYSDLQRRIPDVSKKMLTQTLRQLEADRLLKRTVYPEVPPKVEYELTSTGRKLVEPIVLICEWAKRNQRELGSIFAQRRARRSRGEG